MKYLTEKHIKKQIRYHKDLVREQDGEMMPTAILFTSDSIEVCAFLPPLRPHEQIFLSVEEWKPTEMVYISTAWVAPLDPKDFDSYVNPDISQHPERQEILMLIFIDFPAHKFKWCTIPYYRESGKIHFEEVNWETRMEGGDIFDTLHRCFHGFYPKKVSRKRRRIKIE